MSALHVETLARGPGHTIVASHALGLDHRLWTDWARSLDGRHTVLAFDHRGHGQSVTMQGQSMRALCDEVAVHLAQWSEQPVVFVGLSLGGMVGQGLAIHHPQLLKALVLAHTVSHYGEAARNAWAERVAAVQHGGMEAVVDQVVQRYLCEPVRTQQPALVDRLREALLRNDAQSYARCCAAVAAVKWQEELHRIRMPTLVLGGQLDLGAPPQAVRSLAEAIPSARLALLDGASHLSPWEAPEVFAHQVRTWLDGVVL